MRILFRLLGVIFVILLLFVAALFIIPTERIARIATDQFTAATGRALTISGDVRPTLYPVLGVRTDGVELANADWSQTGPMLTADRLSVGVQLMPLLSGHVEVEEIVVEGARVSLERNVDGQSNWVFETASTDASSEVDSSANGLTPPSGGLPRISLARGALSDTSVEFRDDSTGVLISLTGLTIDMALDGANGAATLAGSGVLNGQTVRLDLDTGDINALLAGQVERVSLKSQLADIKFDFEGRAGLSPVTLDGQTTLDVPQLTPVFALVGQAAPALPGGLDRDLAFSGQVTMSPDGAGRVFVRAGEVRAAGNTVELDADIALGEPLTLAARVSAGDLDLSAFTQGGSTASSTTPSSSPWSAGWSTSFIDTSALALLNGNIALTARSVDLGIMKLGAMDATLALDQSRLVTTLRQVSAYQGGITGELVVNGRGGLSLGGNLRADRVALQPLLIDFADQDRLIGTADLQVQYLAVGNTMDALARSLSGSGSISIGEGELLGLDLAGMLRNLDASFRGEGSKTVFNAITASTSIANGVASNSDLIFDAPLISATGEGTIDIGNQSLAYRLTPVALTGGAGISVPVIIEGPWSDLSFRPDLEALVNQNLAAEREALEEQLRTQAQEALERELGVDVEAAGGNVEQAVRDRVDEQADELRNQVEDQLREGLGRLLGGN